MKRSLILAILAMSYQTPQVFASDWSIGLNVGTVSADFVTESCNGVKQFYQRLSPTTDFTCSNNDDDTTANFNVSYNFNEVWGVEAGYIDLGQYDSTLLGDGSGTFISTGTNAIELFRYNVSAIYAAGTAKWAIDKNWSLLGRLGVSEFDINVDYNTSVLDVNYGDSSTAVMAGAELGYRFNQHWSLNLRYDYFDTNAVDDVISLGARIHF